MKAIMLLAVYSVIIITGFLGWCFNIVKFAKSDFEEPYKSEIVRGVGIALPIMGAVTGYMVIGDEQ